jgi:DNA end-binding protein Ku
MARPLWKGSISFGLVSIPVELYTAVRNHRPRFRMLHAKDKSPVRFQRVCIRDGHPLAWDDLVKGYEYAKGRFVVVSKEDFQAAAVEKTRTVDIIDFVKAEEVDDRFFETPYYLVPAKGGERAYALLREAIHESGRIGIAKFILRDAQHLAAVEVIQKAIVLTVMRFADELVDVTTFDFPTATDVRKPELEMAKALVNSLAAEWDPAKYTDEYRENLMRIIQGKIKGKPVELEAAAEPRQAEVIDLMERLRRSLGQSAPRQARGAVRAAKGRAKSAPRMARASAAKPAPPARTTTPKLARGRKKRAA